MLYPFPLCATSSITLWQRWCWPLVLRLPTYEMTALATGLWRQLPSLYLSVSVFLSLSHNEYLIIYIGWDGFNRGKEYPPGAKKPLPVKFNQSLMYSCAKCCFWRISTSFSLLMWLDQLEALYKTSSFCLVKCKWISKEIVSKSNDNSAPVKRKWL